MPKKYKKMHVRRHKTTVSDPSLRSFNPIIHTSEDEIRIKNRNKQKDYEGKSNQKIGI